MIVWFVATASIVHQRSIPSYDYVAGQTASRHIYSEIPFEYADLDQTEVLREQARRQVPLVYVIDKDHLTEISLVLQKVQGALSQLDREDESSLDDLLPSPASQTEQRARQAIEEIDKDGQLGALAGLFAEQNVVALLERLIRASAMRGIVDRESERTFMNLTDSEEISLIDPHDRRTPREVGSFRNPRQAAAQVVEQFAEQYPQLSPAQRASMENFAAAVLRPNLNYSAATTSIARNHAAASVEIVRKFIDSDTRLVRRGETITSETLVQLRTHAEELQRQRIDENSIQDIAFHAAINLLIIVVCGYGLYLIYPGAVTRKATLTLIVVISTLQLLLVRIGIDLYYLKYSPAIYLLALLPLAMGGLLISQLVSIRAALWVGLFTSLMAGMQHGLSYQMFLVGMVTSCTAAVLVKGACRRHQVLRAGFGIGLAGFAVNALFVLGNNQPLDTLMPIAGLSLLNGLGTATLASAIMPLFEFVFGVTSNTTLLELSDLNHPLLKRLQIEAPGTYHHSLMVATLVEQAAAAIGANPLLARVCAYFHDIGKIPQAAYFVENATFGHDSPHQRLQPRMSSLVILNHVKEGLQLASKYKLKKILREAITQHHGTSLVYYFYRRALDTTDQRNGGSIGQEDYRYPGPLPMRKEIVLLGLADACEAACRSLEKPTPRKIQTLVDEIVAGRIMDGQLDRADLTFAELATAKQTIAKALITMQHGRVAYPKEKHNDNPQTDKAGPPTALQKSQAV